MHQHSSGTIRPRRLIVNADDFGISETVNEAVIRAFTEGVLTSCSLMVTGEAFEHAVSLARAHPGLVVPALGGDSGRPYHSSAARPATTALGRERALLVSPAPA